MQNRVKTSVNTPATSCPADVGSTVPGTRVPGHAPGWCPAPRPAASNLLSEWVSGTCRACPGAGASPGAGCHSPMQSHVWLPSTEASGIPEPQPRPEWTFTLTYTVLRKGDRDVPVVVCWPCRARQAACDGRDGWKAGEIASPAGDLAGCAGQGGPRRGTRVAFASGAACASQTGGPASSQASAAPAGRVQVHR